MTPVLFDDIPWSTDRVLAMTMERLAGLGMAPALLPVLADVDVAADLPPGWREWAVAGAPTWANMH